MKSSQYLEDALTHKETVKTLKLLYSDSYFHELDSSIGELSALENLELINYPESEIELPDEIGMLKNLKSITIDSFSLSKVPQIIWSLNNLEKLSLSFPRLNELPLDVGLMRKLKILTLSSDFISTIPDEIFQLDRLEQLFLKGDKIDSIPNKMSRLSFLKSLRLYTPKISGSTIDLSKNSNLVIIDFSGIRELNLILNTNHSNLEELRWGGCEHIPEIIFKMKSLKKLMLDNGHFSSIPDSICNLSNMEYLNFDAGYLTDVNTKMFEIPNLKNVSMRFSKKLIDEKRKSELLNKYKERISFV